MNALQQSIPPSQSFDSNEDGINFAEYFDIVVDNRWLILAITVLALGLGFAYALFASPVYESNLLVQVEDSEKSAGSFLGDTASSLFSVKTPAAGEIEIIRSRMILGQAVENTKLYIEARPKYIPIIGRWMARRSESLSEPGFMGFKGYTSGTEKIVVPQFDVDKSFEGIPFTVTVMQKGSYSLTHPLLSKAIIGVVGAPLISNEPGLAFKLLVSEIDGNPGAEFIVNRFSKLLILNTLQSEIKVMELGKQSGVMNVSLQGTNPFKLAELLNEIGGLYVRQNIDRKAAEALKTLGFLDTQLPQFKRQLEQSEDVYNQYRNQRGTVSLDDEAKNALAQTVELQSRLMEAQQKRRDLSSRFTDNHPSVQTIDSQIAAWNREIAAVNTRIRQMPILQQDTVRMQRDIKVNTDLYQSLLNSSLQMKLAKEGKVGNVRLLDEALVPEDAIKPKRTVILLISLFAGLFFGGVASILRTNFFGGVRNPQEIEASTGVGVYSSIPLSVAQEQLAKSVQNKEKGLHLLAISSPNDPAIESLRSLRTALQFAMLEAGNNRVLITGGTPGVGKSFVSVNFSAIMAAAGKRVLLIDADLRKGYINQYFSIPRANGLSELIANRERLNDVIHVGVVPNLDILTTGVLPPNPAELLMSESFSSILEEISALYDLVIIDSPPVLVAADAVAVAAHAGTILLVARSDKTQLGELHESIKRLAHVGQSINGVLLNAMDMSRRYYGSYGYRYSSYKYTQYNYESRES